MKGSSVAREASDCLVCGDKATGNHYGFFCKCDWFWGFFRRSIRKSHNYVCRFNHKCQVDKNHRNACRACRLQKCIKAGMKSDAIQNERDSIGKRRKTDEANGEPLNPLLERLLQSERLCQQLRSSVIKSTEQARYDCGKVKVWGREEREATIDDVGKSIHQQLVLLVEWAKTLPSFNSLALSDQANAAQVIVLGVAHRSIALEPSAICLANDRLLFKEQAQLLGDINCVVTRIIDELVIPMKKLKIDYCEYVALKAILFFNPERGSVEEARRESVVALERRCSKEPCRLAYLLLLLPSLESVSQQLIEDVQLARLFGLANVDVLMQELILHDGSAKQLLHSLSSPSPHPSPQSASTP